MVVKKYYGLDYQNLLMSVKNKIIGFCDKKQKRINTLELQVETLENIIKDELYNEFMAKL